MATADTDNPTDNVTPIRPFDEEAAIAWLCAQPGGRTKLSDAELARRWGWNRKRVGRRIKAWAKSGRVTRRGDVTTATAAGTDGKAVPPRFLDRPRARWRWPRPRLHRGVHRLYLPAGERLVRPQPHPRFGRRRGLLQLVRGGRDHRLPNPDSNSLLLAER